MPGRLPLSIMIALGACVWALALILFGVPVHAEFVKPFAVVVTVLSLALLGFDRWLWRLWGVRALVGRPVLVGTYWGEIRSEAVTAPTGLKRAPIPAALVVTQTCTTLAVTVFTEESSSVTLTASLEKGTDGRFSVVGLYRNEPRLSVQDRSRSHHGGLRLHLAGGTTPRLEGSYWTDRGTQGEMEVRRVTTNRAPDFAAARALVPTTDG